MQHSLAIRLPNWVGDVIMAIPALRKLERAGFELHLFGKGWIKDLLASTPYHLHRMPHSICHIRHKLKACPATHALLFTNSFSSAFHFKIGGKKTLGFNTDARKLLLNHPIQKGSATHEANHFLRLAEEAIALWAPNQSKDAKQESDIETETPPPLLTPSSTLLSSIKTQHASALQDPYWVICPFAVGSTKEGIPKVWPDWLSFIKLLKEADTRLIICPGPGEEIHCEPFNDYVTPLHGLSLSEYAAVLQGASQVVANDSGPMHLASAVGAPTLGIFGVTDPQRTSPLGGDYIGSEQSWPTMEEVLARLNLSHCGFNQ